MGYFSVTQWPCSPVHTCCRPIRFMYSCIAILPCVRINDDDDDDDDDDDCVYCGGSSL